MRFLKPLRVTFFLPYLFVKKHLIKIFNQNTLIHLISLIHKQNTPHRFCCSDAPVQAVQAAGCSIAFTQPKERNHSVFCVFSSQNE